MIADPLITPKDPSSYPWYFRLLFRLQRKRFGQVLIPTLIWSYVPKLSLVFLAFYQVFQRKKSPLSPELQSLVQVRVAQIHACKFCIDLNTLFLAERISQRNKLEEVIRWRENVLFSFREKLALEYAEAMTQTECRVTEDLRRQIKENFSNEEIVELTALIAFQNLSARFNAALAIPSQGLCQFKSN